MPLQTLPLRWLDEWVQVRMLQRETVELPAAIEIAGWLRQLVTLERQFRHTGRFN